MTQGTALVIPDATEPKDRIRLARIVSRRTVEEMAIELGLSKSTYERIENGTRPPRRGELIAIAKLTGQDLDFFGASLRLQEGDGERVLPHPLSAVNEE